MKQSYKKILSALVVGSIAASSLNVLNVKADEIIYSDKNVSLTAAIDSYIENYEYAFEEYSIDITKEVAKEDTKKEVVNEENKGETTEQVATCEVTEISNVEVTEVATGIETVSRVASNYVGFEGKGLIAIGDTVNIRSEASTDSKRVGVIGSCGLMNVIDKGDEWSYISSGNVEGYIKNEFVLFDSEASDYAANNLDKVAVVNASSLSLREKEDSNSDCLTILPNGEKYRILDIGDAWTKLEVEDGLVGYVSNEYIDITYNTTVASAVSDEDTQNTSDNNYQEETTQTNEDNNEQTTETEQQEWTAPPASSLGEELVNYALQFVGNPYVYGGTSLTNGADCSGFAMRIYEHFGYSIPRTADVQATVGTPISLAELAPGDLVFYDHGSGSIQHVAIYIGNGQIVHASNSRTGIIVSNAYYSIPCRAVRILN